MNYSVAIPDIIYHEITSAVVFLLRKIQELKLTEILDIMNVLKQCLKDINKIQSSQIHCYCIARLYLIPASQNK